MEREKIPLSNLITILKDLLQLLNESGIALYVQWPKKVTLRQGKVYIDRITWASARGSVIQGEFATLEEYGQILSSGQYSALLYDGALLQISYDLMGKEVINHRLAYYPWPFLKCDLTLLATDSPIDVFDLYMSERMHCRLNTPIRFDYTQVKSLINAPLSHLHLNRDFVRLPVSKPVGLGQFMHFIFRNFYPNDWSTYEFLQKVEDFAFDPEDYCLEENDASFLHVLCP